MALNQSFDGRIDTSFEEVGSFGNGAVLKPMPKVGLCILQQSPRLAEAAVGIPPASDFASCLIDVLRSLHQHLLEPSMPMAHFLVPSFCIGRGFDL